MKKKVVVFGATGNLGAYIAVHLNNQGYEVIGVGHRKYDNNFFADN
jgi:UDP-glucose 4-epimerase